MAAISAPPNAFAQEDEHELRAVAGESALVKTGGDGAGSERESRDIDPESVVCRMPVELEVAVPVRDFRVRNLLALSAETLVSSVWNHGEDLPLAAGHVQLAWVEFEVLDSVLAARVTRPA